MRLCLVEIRDRQALVGTVRVRFLDRARTGAIEHDRNAVRRVVPRVGVERYAGGDDRLAHHFAGDESKSTVRGCAWRTPS